MAVFCASIGGVLTHPSGTGNFLSPSENCDNCPMEITEQCVVALTWVLQDSQGQELDVLDEPVEFLLGGQDLLAAIEQALQGHSSGARLSLHLEPEEAFGDFDEQLLFLAPRQQLPAEIEEGMCFERSALPADLAPTAAPQTLLFVSEIYPEHVVLDGNHPLAGMALKLQLQVHQVRPATAEELSQGSLGAGFFRIDA